MGDIAPAFATHTHAEAKTSLDTTGLFPQLLEFNEVLNGQPARGVKKRGLLRFHPIPNRWSTPFYRNLSRTEEFFLPSLHFSSYFF